jgi:hypothetical protein
MGGRYGPQDPIEDPWKPVDGYVSVCIICGWPLPKQLISGALRGEFIDHDERGQPEEIYVEVCSECKARAREFIQGGIPAAIRRLEVNRG